MRYRGKKQFSGVVNFSAFMEGSHFWTRPAYDTATFTAGPPVYA